MARAPPQKLLDISVLFGLIKIIKKIKCYTLISLPLDSDAVHNTT